MDFDLTDLDLYARGFPHDVFTWLRREAPVYWHPPTAKTPDGEGFWVVSRHADVVRVQLDAAAFSSVTGGARPAGGTLIQDSPIAGLLLNEMDDPRHRRVRSIVNRGFTPRTIGALEGELVRRTREILARVVARGGECDFVRDVARELPLQAICMLLGVPQRDRDALCHHVDTMLAARGHVGGRHEALDAVRSGAFLRDYGSALVAAKRRAPGDDMLSAVVLAELPGEDPPRLGAQELELFFTLLFVAGAETTRKAIAGGLLALVEAPAQLERLRARPELLDTAVEEIVRWTTPSCYKRRTATRDVELAGEKIRAGDKVTFWEMSANRDERVFGRPFELDVVRDPNPHVGFGHGAHYCLGANLARLEIRVMLGELLATFRHFEVTGPTAWTRDNRLLGLARLPMRLEPARGTLPG